jgi:hypothetical protein
MDEAFDVLEASIKHQKGKQIADKVEERRRIQKPSFSSGWQKTKKKKKKRLFSFSEIAAGDSNGTL